MPNLSVEKIAGALAVLGTTVAISACGGAADEKPAASPVNATETAAPTAPAPEAAKDEHHCGAGSEHKGGASCGAPASDTGVAGAAVPPASATPAVATPPTAEPTTKAAEAPKPEPKKDDKKAADKKPAAPAKKATGAASCGAGTCAAKK